MSLVSRQVGILASHRLNGQYRFQDTFQLLPSSFKCEMLGQDHPLILEVCFDSEVWPRRPEGEWYRDQWEQERYEHMTKTLGDSLSDDKKRWLETYQQTTQMRRFGAIISELVSLLSLFTNYRFLYSNSAGQSWFVSLDPDRTPVWGQKWFTFDECSQGTSLSPSSIECAPSMPYQEYYAKIYGAIVVGEENDISFPDNLDQLMRLYFSLGGRYKECFHKACHLYCKALDLASESASLSLMSSAMAIEALANADSDRSRNCENCGTPEHLEKCDLCGAPRYRATTKFKEFIAEYLEQSSEVKTFAKRLYEVRSSLAHGGLLRDDLHDSGFYTNDREEEQQLRRNARRVTRLILINWLLRNGNYPIP